MTKIVLIFFFIVATFATCSSVKNRKLPTQIKQGIEGFVYQVSGNQMPFPGMPASIHKGISTIIYIYEVTNIKEVSRNGTSPFYQSIKTKQIAAIQSDSLGHFIIQLPIGSYSLFTKVNHLFYANSFDVNNNISFIKVEEEKISPVILKIDADASY